MFSFSFKNVCADGSVLSYTESTVLINYPRAQSWPFLLLWLSDSGQVP